METEHEPIPPGTSVMAKFRWILIVLSAALCAFSWWSIASADPSSATAPRFYCPMHPEIVSHDPGECPICHMTLEPIPESRKKGAAPKPNAAASPSASAAAPAEDLYVCPMHPEVKSKEPGSCPICKMDLVKKSPPAAAPAEDLYVCPMHPEVHSKEPGRCPICKMDLVKQAPAAPPGTVPIELTLDRVQAIGVRTALAEPSSESDRLRAPAVIEAAESGFAAVHARAAGFIERVAVRETGVKVRAGQELAALYSPEIYQAQAELLAVNQWTNGPDGAITAERVKKKLSLLGVGEATMKRIVERGEAQRTVSLSAPISGYVSKKNVVLGTYVTPDTPLFEIVDLSKVYIVANLYPAELAHVAIGTEGEFRAADDAHKSISAKVDLIYPAVDASARTKRVRLQVKNPDTALTPGQYGTVEFAAPGSKSVSVPRDALIDTGRHTYVFVALGEGRFEPRSVTLGAEAGEDRLEITRGLEPGERVVSGATFLIDSESRLRASLAEIDTHTGHPR